jgi:hypothetical protein
LYLWQLWHYCIIFRNDKNSQNKNFEDQNFENFYWIFRNILFVETKISEVINYLTEMLKLSMYYNTPHFRGLPFMFRVSHWGLKVYNLVQTILHYSSQKLRVGTHKFLSWFKKVSTIVLSWQLYIMKVWL